jgi:hypothetical protein
MLKISLGGGRFVDPLLVHLDAQQLRGHNVTLNLLMHWRCEAFRGEHLAGQAQAPTAVKRMCTIRVRAARTNSAVIAGCAAALFASWVYRTKGYIYKDE